MLNPFILLWVCIIISSWSKAQDMNFIWFFHYKIEYLGHNKTFFLNKIPQKEKRKSASFRKSKFQIKIIQLILITGNVLNENKSAKHK